MHHLRCILTIAGAKHISMFHPQFNWKSDRVSASSVEPIPQLSNTEISLFNTKQTIRESTEKELIIKQIDEKNILIQASDLISTNIGGLAHNDTDATLSKPTLSRRTPIKPFNRDQFYFIKIEFSHTLPSWLLPPNNSLDGSNSTYAAFEQLIVSAGMQSKLISDYVFLLSDPLTNLCSRSVLQSKIAQLSQSYSIGLVMVHCIDFHQINKKFGHQFGDNVIQEIASNLNDITRDGDILCRFGGALFGVAFPVNEQTDVASLAKKLQRSLQQKQYLDGAINLLFDLGAAIVEHNPQVGSESESANTLINRADQALKVAQQENQPSIITWHKDDFNLYQQQFNYLGGIFTADTVTDYRNMLLLWDISSLIADKFNFSQLSQSVVQRLAQTFDFMCAGIVSNEEQNQNEFKYSIDSNDNAIPLTNKDRAFLAEIKQMQEVAIESRKPSERYMGNILLLVLPLEIETQDCFFICGNAERFEVKHDTKVLLSGLTRQLGKALRRSRLEEELNRKLESQNEQLQIELAQLKEGLQVSSIIYRSQAMENLMRHAKRAALTDTTVLVTGESGTGKERLINALHQMGNRKDKALVIVDCGSIPETLIESELFGHVKGAFTGAQNTTSGKVLDANGGVLVLDEIGELPLNMQTKLLRFVQEKHFTPVGGNKVINVDVKIIAVTNRDLAQEVELGRFRKDLYYRLNVLTLHNPPLRERVEDIALLATHFLKKFAEQFKVEKRTLAPETLEKMMHYPWPGNIRELENRLMQATLLSENSTIDWELLNIHDNGFENSTPHIVPPQTTQIDLPPNTSLTSHHQSKTSIKPAALEEPSFTAAQPSTIVQPNEQYSVKKINPELYFSELLEIFKHMLATSGQHPKFFNAPFGIWIEDELILKTYLATDRKMRLTAARLSISQSTARRKVDKILKDIDEGSLERPADWSQFSEVLMPIATGGVHIANCVAKIKLLVLEAILHTPVYSMAQAAEMLGVSEPTFYKLKRELDSAD
ncbi:sigma 54-interacting transcriptional regulator [Aliiglaciecola sp. SL4]|uniref:sigma 54-interacting transcriptional regulator n=1 Tax=Aliiglaciecola sp. SL4 TaxID=3239806 RepID=UPI00355C2B58